MSPRQEAADNSDLTDHDLEKDLRAADAFWQSSKKPFKINPYDDISSDGDNEAPKKAPNLSKRKSLAKKETSSGISLSENYEEALESVDFVQTRKVTIY